MVNEVYIYQNLHLLFIFSTINLIFIVLRNHSELYRIVTISSSLRLAEKLTIPSYKNRDFYGLFFAARFSYACISSKFGKSCHFFC